MIYKDIVLKAVGQRVIKKDLIPVCTGTAEFVADIQVPGMLEGIILKSPYAHARIKSIDTGEAERMPGVVCTIADKDKTVFPHELFTDLRYGLASMAGEVFFAGQEVALLAAETREVAEEAIQLIKVDYEVLPAVFDPKEALKPGAPILHPEYRQIRPDLPDNVAPMYSTQSVHERVSRSSVTDWKTWKCGASATRSDVEQGKKDADFIVSASYRTGVEAHASLETNGSIARWDGDEVTIWSSTQCTHEALEYVTKLLGIPNNKATIIQKYTAGAFGGKGTHYGEFMLVMIYAAALARKAGRPVRVLQDVDEMNVWNHHSIGPVYFDMNCGMKKDGTPTFIESTVTVNIGGVGHGDYYAAFPANAATGVYRYGSVYTEAYPVWCNLPLSGSRRSFGDAEGMMNSEQFIDEVIEKTGQDPAEWRKKWSEVPGGPTIDKLTWYTLAGGNYPALITKAAEAFGWKEKWKGWGVPTAVNGPKRRGVGCALSLHITGGHWGEDPCVVKISVDGTVEVISSGVDCGQGLHSAMCQCVADVLGVPYENVRKTECNSRYTPYGGGIGASKGTPKIIGGAIKAAFDARRQLFDMAAKSLNVRAEDLNIADSKVFVKSDPSKFQTIASLSKPVKGILGVFEGTGNKIDPVTKIGTYEKCLAALFAEIEVDTETGKIDVLKIVSCDDCGIAINPDAVEAQIRGATMFGYGFGLYGSLYFDQAHQGIVVNASAIDYRTPTYLEEVDMVPIIHEDPADAPTTPLGMKGVGEGANVPVGPAIGNAFYNATGVRMRNHPWTPDKVLEALGKI
ncbi:MAG: xanthine dehydrogenase family protein molybdopterin-binding subunit [Thermodesulfobacteriota bacterium]